MGGFQSRESQCTNATTVGKLLKYPGKSVQAAGQKEHVIAVLTERFETVVQALKEEISYSSGKKKQKVDEEKAGPRFQGNLAPNLDTKLPENTEVVDLHLFGSAVPLTRDSVDALVALGVRTFVSFTVMPLTDPRAIHVNLSDFHNPAFMDRDPDMLDGLFNKYNCAAVHMPVNDAGTLSTKQATELVKLCRTSREKDEAVLVHCWGGSRRTWMAIRTVKRVLDNINADDICRRIGGKKAVSNPIVDAFLKSPKFPEAASDNAERLQLLALAAALQAVSGGGGLFDTKRKNGPAIMFTTFWPSINARLNDATDAETLRNAMKENQSLFGITESSSRHFPQKLQSEWCAFADKVLLRACSGDREVASSIMEELKQRGPKSVRDEINNSCGCNGFLQDKFTEEEDKKKSDTLFVDN